MKLKTRFRRRKKLLVKLVIVIAGLGLLLTTFLPFIPYLI